MITPLLFPTGRLRTSRGLTWIAGVAVVLHAASAWAESSTSDLAVAAQNPVAAMYSLPFQNNTYGDAGPSHNKTANVLNIQPVLPFTTGNWNIISRTIAPLISLPSFVTGIDEAAPNAAGGTSSKFGLGDINQSFYFSPAAARGFIWGVGPSVTLPTATDRELGSGKLSIGPAAVGLVTPKPWVIGLLARQLWSVAGPEGRKDVNQTLLQPFVNYNLPEGWYLVSAPIITANWTAESSQRWSVPVGGGIGKIFKIAGQPLNATLQGYDYVDRPSAGANWAIRFEITLLFPR